MKKTKTPSRPKAVHKKVRRHVKLAVVPNKANQFRPHLIRRHGLAALLVAVAVLFFGSNWMSSGSVLGDKVEITADSLLKSTNYERVERRINGLKYSEQLSQAAMLKAKDMLKQQYWAHTAPDGTTPWEWFSQVGYDYAHAGENLARNFRSAEATVTAWMGSEKHRENILNNAYTEVGFAVVGGMLNNQKTTLIVALYGQPLSDDTAVGVAGVHENMAPVLGDMSLMTRFGVALQSVTPAALSSIFLLLFATLVALMAHTYRKRLPFALQRSWRYHHGLYKAVGLMTMAIVLIAIYSGGQI